MRRLTLLVVLFVGGLATSPAIASATGGPTADTALPLPIGVPFSTDTTKLPTDQNTSYGYQSEDWYSVPLVAGDTVTITVQNKTTLDSGLGSTGLYVCATQLAWPHGPSPNADGHMLGSNGSWLPCADGNDVDITAAGAICGNQPCRSKQTTSFTVVPGGAGTWVIGFHDDDALIYQATATVTRHGPGAAAPVVVSLGDSYSSGEGNPPYDAGTDESHDDRCHRSTAAWPRLLGVGAQDHLACSGAKIGNFYSGQHHAAPDNVGQIARLYGIAQSQSVSDVLVGIAGNDLGFADIIKSCFKGAGCLANIDGVERPKLAAIGKRLVQAYRDISQAAPGARRIVVGYPGVIPSGTPVGCSWLSTTEQARALRVQSMLESTIKQAAQKAGATFVSVLSATAGHELCTRRSWFVPVATANIGNPLTNQQQGHPRAQAQQAIAQIVRSLLAPATPAPGTESALSSRTWYGLVEHYAPYPPGTIPLQGNDPFDNDEDFMSSLQIAHPTSTTNAGQMVTASQLEEQFTCKLTFVRHDGTGWYYHATSVGTSNYDEMCEAADGTLRVLPVTSDALDVDWQPDATSQSQPMVGIFGDNSSDRTYTQGDGLKP